MRGTFYSILFTVAFYACAQVAPPADLVISDVNIVDVRTGEVLEGRHLRIENGQIMQISDEAFLVSDSVETLNGKGKFLIPGLWDMHTHYHWNHTWASQLLIANGVTGVREMWGDMDNVNAIRDKNENEGHVAPDIYSAGAIIDGTPPIWEGSVGVDNAEEAVEEINKQYEDGVDFFKVYSLLSPESYQAIAARSKELGVPFAGHVPGRVTIWEAISAGQQSAEHMYGLLEACTSRPEEWARFEGAERFGAEAAHFLVDYFDQQLFDSLARVLAKSDTWMSPTLSVLQRISSLDDTTLRMDPRMKYMPEFIHNMWDPRNDFRFQSRGPEFYEASRRRFELRQRLLGELAAAGVKIIAGTDYPNPYCYPGFSLHDELELMVEAGMSPLSVLQSATVNAAVFMGKEDSVGVVSEGGQASLVMLDANPLEDIGNTRRIHSVVLRGRVLDREDLEALLKEAQDLAAETR